jgi:cystathionine beta-lyase/cystathionine gamma-synthase
LRWQKISDTAYKVAQYLESNSKIKRVSYPLLKSHADYEISQRQLFSGAGGVVSFELKSDDLNIVERFVNKLTENDTIIYAESLASPQTILAYPAWMSHRAISSEDRLSLGISDSFFRLSVGFEHIEDIIEQFERALDSI